jgi:uncharacterized protein YaiI (UPF0178 family)
MSIWVDADACPRAIKEILFRAAERTRTPTILVANAYLRTPPSAFVSAMQVPSGFDVADNAIVERVQAGDLVITADIPLADAVVTRGALAINPRGAVYTAENIKDHLSRRDLMEQLRSNGMVSGGPAALSKQDVQGFANALDRYLASAR